MDSTLISTIRDWSIASLAVVSFGYIIYIIIKKLFDLLKNIQEEHRADQVWFQTFVNENNHQKTDLITKVSDNIAQNTASLEIHTKAIEKLIDKLD